MVIKMTSYCSCTGYYVADPVYSTAANDNQCALCHGYRVYPQKYVMSPVSHGTPPMTYEEMKSTLPEHNKSQ